MIEPSALIPAAPTSTPEAVRALNAFFASWTDAIVNGTVDLKDAEFRELLASEISFARECMKTVTDWAPC